MAQTTHLASFGPVLVVAILSCHTVHRLLSRYSPPSTSVVRCSSFDLCRPSFVAVVMHGWWLSIVVDVVDVVDVATADVVAIVVVALAVEGDVVHVTYDELVTSVSSDKVTRYAEFKLT